MIDITDGFIEDAFLGLDEKDATIAAEGEGFIARVTSRDGTPYIVTMDYRRDRINFWIDRGKVTRARIG